MPKRHWFNTTFQMNLPRQQNPTTTSIASLRENSVSGIDIDSAETDASIVITGGISSLVFSDSNTAANSTAHQIDDIMGTQISIVLPFRGSIVAMGVSGSAAKSAGACRFDFYINGSASGAYIDVPNQQYSYQRFSKAQYGWIAGDIADVRVTTDGSYSPVTNDYEVVCYLALDQSEVQ